MKQGIMMVVLAGAMAIGLSAVSVTAGTGCGRDEGRGSAGCVRQGSSCQQGEKGAGHRMWADIDLSADQKTKLAKLREEFKTEQKAGFESMKSLRDQVAVELKKEAPDRKLLSKISQEMGNSAQAMSEKRINHVLAVKSILTKEQFARFIDRQKEMGPGTHGEGPRCGE